jgi:hypothetical protein
MGGNWRGADAACGGQRTALADVGSRLAASAVRARARPRSLADAQSTPCREGQGSAPWPRYPTVVGQTSSGSSSSTAAAPLRARGSATIPIAEVTATESAKAGATPGTTTKKWIGR